MVDTKRWPAWCNGPNGETAIVNSPDELPKGWHHPRLDKKPTGIASNPEPTSTPPAASSEEEVDSAGWAWSAELHASSKSKTKDGLWRMKVGVTRPAPKVSPAPLDL